MPVTPHGISYLGLLLFHKQRHYLCPATFRPRPVIDPYIRRFVSAFSSCVVTAHSDHRHFVGLRHIAYIACLQASFVILLLRYASADFTELLTLLHLPCIHASRSIKVALRGVTPSFDYSHIQFSSYIKLFAVPALFKQERVAPQNGSCEVAPLGVVDLNRFVTSLCTSLSSLRYTNGL